MGKIRSMVIFNINIFAVYMATFLICLVVDTTRTFDICDSLRAPAADSLDLVPAPSLELPVGTDLAPNAYQDGVFDVTSYGAVADGKTETSSAFLAAWNDACSYDGNSTLLIPEGTFFVSPVTFEGPCYNNQSPKIQIRGNLKAPSSLDAFATSTWIMFQRLRGFNLTGETGPATFDAQGEEAWAHAACHNRPTSLRFVNISNGMISNIALLNSKGFHISFFHSENIVVDGVNIKAPWDSPNTDGIHISSSTNINITSSTIGVGDDCVSIGPGSTNVTVFNITCGPGHGISVGSLGKYPNEENVMGVNVRNCTINGTKNGARIKTWPGEEAIMASNLTFEDIVMINVSHPIIIDQNYCPGHNCQNSKPSHVKLINVLFKNIRGTSNTEPAVTLLCSSSETCQNVQLVDIKLTYVTADGRQPLNTQFEGDRRVPFVAYKSLSKLKFFTKKLKWLLSC